MQLKKKILNDRYNALVFKKYSGNIYLVGGYVRDILRGIESKDRDYVVKKNIKRIVREISAYTKGTIIKFKKGDMYRIVTSDGYILDFTEHAGMINQDLSKRDFTINALAWSPEDGLVDLFQGVKDIERKIIRSIAKENFIHDPLRIIRAYRFAAEIKGTIENKTKKQIKALKSLINQVSSERITLELFKLLNQPDSSRYLTMLLNDTVLSSIILLKNNILDRNIRAVCKLERGNFKELSPKFKALLKKEFSQNLTYKGLLCLEQMLQYTEKYDYILKNLCVSKKILKRIILVNYGIKKIEKAGKKLQEKLFDIFRISREAVIDVLILTNTFRLYCEHERYRRVMKKGILSSKEIINTTSPIHGEKIKKAIIMIKKAQFNGKIRNKKQAKELLKYYKKRKAFI